MDPLEIYKFSGKSFRWKLVVFEVKVGKNCHWLNGETGKFEPL